MMNNLETRKFLIFFLSVFLICCKQEQKTFTQKELLWAVKYALSDQNLESRMGILQENKVKKWILNGEFKIQDTINVADRQYHFEMQNSYSKSDSSILYQITYPNINAAHVSLQYIPNEYNMIKGDFDFIYINGNWKFLKRINSISDGKFY